MDAPADPPVAFFLYRDAPLRREALRLGRGAPERYSLYGLDEVADTGFAVEHNLEPGREPGPDARVAARVLQRAVRLGGGYGGDFASVLACRKRVRAADVVFSTVDTVGIPLALLGRAGLVRTPVVYAAIGLPERLAQLRTAPARRLYLDAYRRLHTIVAYGRGEVDALRAWLGEDGPRLVFVPFGVDTGTFRPEPGREPAEDVVSVGADPRRDLPLLLRLAERLPGRRFRVVCTAEQARALGTPPANVAVETDVPLRAARERLLAARLVVLPVRENTYSGATTVLLQAMACGKPVVASRTAAIADGYHLQDGANCRLVPPGDLAALEAAVSTLLADPERAATLGARARETVERHLTWERYAQAIGELLWAAAGRTTVPV